MNRSLRGRVAVVGVGETMYYKAGQSPDAEFKLALKAILAACEDAGIDPKDVDGFASYSNDRSDPSRLAAALGCRELRFANMQWGGGGGGGSGALGNAAAAVATGMADCVVVFRALAQGQFGRFGQGPRRNVIAGDMAHVVPYGLMSPARGRSPWRLTTMLRTTPVRSCTDGLWMRRLTMRLDGSSSRFISTIAVSRTTARLP
jgi:hypothetical protein